MSKKKGRKKEGKKKKSDFIYFNCLTCQEKTLSVSCLSSSSEYVVS